MNRFALFALVLGSLVCAQVRGDPVDVPLSVPSDDQARLGIASTALQSRTLNLSVDAIIRSVDPAPLAALNSDLLAATAAAAASRNELQRVTGLVAQDRSASQQALELARARAAADSAGVSLLRQRLLLEWGPGFAALSESSRQDLVEAISDGTAALLRADVPTRAEGVSGRVFVEVSDAREIVASETLGHSGTADQRMQTIGLYCVVRGPEARSLRPGRVLKGRIETDTTITGVVLPRSALIRTGGRTWTYVRIDDVTFARREVVDGWPVADGWYATEGFEPGVAIVDKGAGSIAAFEFAGELTEQD